jgi:flagellar M-ring protein FliF
MASEEKNSSFWSGLSLGSRVGLLAGVSLILAAALALAVWSSSTDYEVLFARLSEGDAANVVDQLKRQKVPYRLADDGTTVKVPAGKVYETRLALVTSGLPLSGGVGFEIFDRQGFGVTEQSQRVAYQRALQGELARTISAIDSVKSARVHLVLPETTMFKRDREEPRAAVSLILKPDAALTPQQTTGIQRLVAASVAGLDSSKVVITDQHGMTLSQADGMASGTAGSDARLSIKRDIEAYVARKVGALLDRAFGAGQALVSVDISLNFDDIKSTVQGLVPLRPGAAAEGALLRRRQVETGGNAGGQVLSSEAASAAGVRPSGSTTEVEYEYGRRVEQVIAAPGSITHMSVGVVVPGDLPEDKRKRISDLVRMAAGINEARGDAVVVQPLDQLGIARAAVSAGETVAEPDPVAAPAVREAAVPAIASAPRTSARWWLAAGLAALVFAVIGLLAGLVIGRVRTQSAALSAEQRQQMLTDLERSLAAEAPRSARATL